MKSLCTAFVALLLSTFSATAQENLWVVEAEDPLSQVEWRGDTAEIWAPKGLTLWHRPELRGNIRITYRVCFPSSADPSPANRLSDMNCFWMATDPTAPAGSIWVNAQKRGGAFKNCATLALYYVGYGGNYNSTTRFRRYDGRPSPALLQEYTDPSHLLRPDHWYEVSIETSNGQVCYSVDGELLFQWDDPSPLRHGWFGYRTTLSHSLLCGFKVEGE